MKITITPRTVLARLILIIVVLLLANLFVIFLNLYIQYGDPLGWTNVFNFEAEMNVPTLFSSFLLTLSAILLAIIATTHKRLGSSHLPWFGLAFVFLFLAIDETVGIHERIAAPTSQLMHTSGLLHFSWVIPYGIAVAIFCIIYMRFLVNLPRRTMIFFIVSGVTYVSGSLGLEMISAPQYELHGVDGLIYMLIVSCEESLEMLGVVIFIYALLQYITEQFEGLTISTEQSPEYFRSN